MKSDIPNTYGWHIGAKEPTPFRRGIHDGMIMTNLQFKRVRAHVTHGSPGGAARSKPAPWASCATSFLDPEGYGKAIAHNVSPLAVEAA